jgi:D-beta-D-heptose 7-phosphate kinase/D-beta-D-heptose 1-phosphate adenosyltransferase
MMAATTGLSKAQAQAYVSGFASARVLVLGDIMLDRYFWGDAERISPEAPVPVVKVTRRGARLGGAANVAANLRAVGAQVALAGTVGEDPAGEEIRGLLESRGIDTGRVVVSPACLTTEKVRIIAHSQQVVRADFERAPTAAYGEVERVLSHVAEQSDDFSALVISDYGKGVVNTSYLGRVIATWRGRGKAVLVDPHIGHFPWYRGASIVTPNTKEAASYFAPEIGRDELLSTGALRMREELALDALLITQGEEGMSLFYGDGEKIHIPTDATEVYDVTGAGDTVISVLSAAMASGVPLVQAVILSNRAAGEVVKEVGTSPITREKLLRSFA